MAKSRARSVSQTPKPAPPPWRNLSRRALIAAALLTFLVVGMALALPTASAQPANSPHQADQRCGHRFRQQPYPYLDRRPGRRRPHGDVVHVRLYRRSGGCPQRHQSAHLQRSCRRQLHRGRGRFRRQRAITCTRSANHRPDPFSTTGIAPRWSPSTTPWTAPTGPTIPTGPPIPPSVNGTA